ncbi:hypothetical protein CEUSTIGMA_g7023.t1 [Chlamydomonas eustigma]|uniref:Uncharacterized protein n=1 Tax=Chlamydomonas eustigma TaxID=1157962 RepID=A0A250X9P3_9CHLO|nr:hypothetical protein CEUSTIGMA_g7023.t1 [Chlamydomonas eustigma]|eukprot:GAX79582.1 hypothetical protein CEUSTIGMA_g7023.t1 [Chlamydomonas eustigma]
MGPDSMAQASPDSHTYRSLPSVESTIIGSRNSQEHGPTCREGRLIADQLMVTDRARMNPVYRMIRKKELQYNQGLRRQESSSTGTARKQIEAPSDTSVFGNKSNNDFQTLQEPLGVVRERTAGVRDERRHTHETDLNGQESSRNAPRTHSGSRSSSQVYFQKHPNVAASSMINDDNMASERSRLNPVYRLIRKTELQYKHGMQRPDAWQSLRGPGPALGSQAAAAAAEDGSRMAGCCLLEVTRPSKRYTRVSSFPPTTSIGQHVLSLDMDDESVGNKGEGGISAPRPESPELTPKGKFGYAGVYGEAAAFKVVPRGKSRRQSASDQGSDEVIMNQLDSASTGQYANSSTGRMGYMAADQYDGNASNERALGVDSPAVPGAVFGRTSAATGSDEDSPAVASKMVLESEIVSDKARMNPVFRLIRKKELQMRLYGSSSSMPAPLLGGFLGGLEEVLSGLDPFGSSLVSDPEPYLAVALDPGPASITSTTHAVHGGAESPRIITASFSETTLGKTDGKISPAIKSMLVPQAMSSRYSGASMSDEEAYPPQGFDMPLSEVVTCSINQHGTDQGREIKPDTSVNKSSLQQPVCTGIPGVDRTIRIRQILLRMRNKAAAATSVTRSGGAQSVQSTTTSAYMTVAAAAAAASSVRLQNQAYSRSAWTPWLPEPASTAKHSLHDTAVSPAYSLPPMASPSESCLSSRVPERRKKLITSDRPQHPRFSSGEHITLQETSIPHISDSPTLVSEWDNFSAITNESREVPPADACHEGTDNLTRDGCTACSTVPRMRTRPSRTLSWKKEIPSKLTKGRLQALQSFQAEFPELDLEILLGIPSVNAEYEHHSLSSQHVHDSTCKAQPVIKASSSWEAGGRGEGAEVALASAERLQELLKLLHELGVPRRTALKAVGGELDVNFINSRCSKKHVKSVGERMAGLAGVLGLSLVETVGLTTKQPNLINRKEESLSLNVTRLEEVLKLPRSTIEEMIKRYPAMLEMSPMTVSEHLTELAKALGVEKGSNDQIWATFMQLQVSWRAAVNVPREVTSQARPRKGKAGACKNESEGPAYVRMKPLEATSPTSASLSSAATLFLNFPGLLSVSSEKITLKFERLARYAAGKKEWETEIQSMTPKALGRILAASFSVLDRLEFFLGTGAHALGVRKKPLSLLKLITLPSSKFEELFPDFSCEIVADHA